ncbi:MAG: hypothetical protein V4671_07180 [Armatimonadota bacterium]
MGAESWEHFVPFRTDFRAALQDLQTEVFARGQFHNPCAEIEFLEEMDFFAATDGAREQMLSEYGLSALREPLARLGSQGLRKWLGDLSAAPGVGTREELAALSCLSAEGTKSVLDMQGISDETAPGLVRALPTPEIAQLFGKERPTRIMVEQNQELYERIDRGHGICFAVYRQDLPDEIFFGGYSYD